MSNSENPTKSLSTAGSRSGNWTTRLVVLACLIGGTAALLTARPSWLQGLARSDDNPYAHLITQTARKGPFLVSLSVQGHLDSQRNSTLSSQVEGGTTIISIVPEGTWVEEGEIVCELDSSTLREEEKTQQILVTQAEAAEAQARENLAIQRTQNESDIAAADLALTLAELDLEKYIKGELPQQLNEVNAKIELARQEYVQAQENHEFTKRLVKKGYKNQNDLEAARIAERQKELALAGAQEEFKVLNEYMSKRTETELDANAKEFKRELKRVELKAKAAEAQFAKEYEAAQLTLEVEREKLKRLRTQIEACTLRAPQNGEVVYANLSNSRRGNDEQQIEEGATVRERQAIINLPDVTQMKVDCRIHESLIGNVRMGLPARVRVDAFPSELFRGRIAVVSSVPMSGSWPNYDLREYETEIHLTEIEKVKEKELKPGMTAQVTILIDSRQDVLQIPMQSVIATGGKYFGFVLGPDGPQRRELRIGDSNESDIEVLDGVAEGERVIMNPRTHFADEIAELEATYGGAGQDDDEDMEIPPPIPGAGPPAVEGGAPRGRPPGAGAGGARAEAGGDNADGPGPGGARGNSARMFQQRDTNKDGKLTADELPARLKERLAEIDTDGDGAVTAAEMGAFSQAQGGATRPPRAGGESPQPGGGGGN